MGTCTISRLINIIHKSEIDNLATPWLTVRLAQLLSCWLGIVVPSPEGAETLEEGTCGGSPEVNIDELVTVWESIHLGPFQTEIIEGRVKPLPGSTSYVMITPLKVEGQQCETKPLPLGLHVLHAHTRLKNGSGRVSLVVRNMSESQIFLKKGMLLVQVVSAMLVSPAELSLEMEAALGKESRPEPLLVAVRQEKLLEKLNLDRLAHWSPENAVAVRELVLAYHDVFTLESNELGCTSTMEHKICIKNGEPFKEWFRSIPPPLLEEVRASLRDMLESGAIHPSQSPWCNVVVTDGIPAYEVKDEAGSVKTIHHNRLFLVATPKEAITPLGVGTSISKEDIVRSTQVEHTLLQVESDSPEGSVDGVDTLSPASGVLLGWVGGLLHVLPSVAPRLTMWRGIGAGDGAESLSDEEVH